MKILILGAAGQIGRMLTKDLLEQTDNELVLFARNASQRLNIKSEKITVVSGDFTDYELLVSTMKNVDAIYLNDMNSKEGVKTIAKAMKESGTKRIILASILGIYDEVPGAFGKWNIRMVGATCIQSHKEATALFEIPEFDYTILRLTWLYNQAGNSNYHLTYKGEPFEGAQVTRQAVSQLITDILQDESGKFLKTSIGVSEPNTNWDKPSFY
ncbi:NmrA-like family protein [compost metagenome]